jgi:predicted oxidoreductase
MGRGGGQVTDTNPYTRGAIEELIEQLRERYGQVEVTETDEGWILHFEANGNGVVGTLQKARETAE